MEKTKKINITVDMEFYNLLNKLAEEEHLKLTTYVKWILHKAIDTKIHQK